MLVLSTDSGSVRTLTLNRPEALNALTPALLVELGDALARAADEASVRVVVLTGTGRAFSAGVDLKALADAPVDGGDVSDALNAPARRVTELLSGMPKVTLAKVNGFCFTGALELALACDLMICDETARMGDTHAKFGLRPTWGMSARLAQAVGVTRARELSYTARTFIGSEAAAMGLAAAAVAPDDLDAAVAEMAEAIAANSAESIAAYKDLYRHQQDLGLADGLRFEYSALYPMSGASDRIAGFGRS
ncbi:MAG: enoyl-CoA hydratase/isomerase family protein [Acidimicrobiales bacterium]